MIDSNGRATTAVAVPPKVSVSWGGVFAGTLIALGFTLLVSSFWVGLSVGSHVSWASGVALEWWLAATAVVAAGLGGFVGSRVGRITDLPSGYLTGNLVWALYFLVASAFALVIPAVGGFSATTAAWLWFPMLIIGLAAAGFGSRRGVFVGRVTEAVGGAARGSEGQTVDVRETQAASASTGEWQSPTRTTTT
jgi:hypothetical protein